MSHTFTDPSTGKRYYLAARGGRSSTLRGLDVVKLEPGTIVIDGVTGESKEVTDENALRLRDTIYLTQRNYDELVRMTTQRSATGAFAGVY